MNAYNPTRPMLRSVFAAVALAVTLGICGAIDALAQHYGAEGHQIATAKTVHVATR